MLTVVYKTLILSVLTYGSEIKQNTQSLSQNDEHSINIFLKKILQNILGPMNKAGVPRLASSKTLSEAARWAGHLTEGTHRK